MNYHAQVRVKGTEDWAIVTSGGETTAFSDSGLPQLQTMVTIMQQLFPQNEYRILEVKDEQC